MGTTETTEFGLLLEALRFDADHYRDQALLAIRRMQDELHNAQLSISRGDAIGHRTVGLTAEFEAWADRWDRQRRVIAMVEAHAKRDRERSTR